ncbi:cystathionine beta-lyase [Rhodovibrionaceae bacterium A322]
MAPQTKLTHLGHQTEVSGGTPVNPPVVRASTLAFDTVAELNNRVAAKTQKNYAGYGIYGTQPQFSLDEVLCDLENGERCLTVPSGLAACAAPLLAFVNSGDHILVADSCYGPTRSFCDGFLARFGVETTYYDPLIGGGISALFRENTKLVFMESPGSWTFEVQDVPAIVAACQEKGIRTAIDNTWATPLFCKPLDMGVDLSIHAGTKYIAGHSDLLIGHVIARDEESYWAVRRQSELLGYNTAPDEAYLTLRGLRTMEVRLKRHESNGIELANWLKERPEVARILHPALPDDPGHELWKRDFTGASGLFGVELKPVSEEAVAAMLDSLKLYYMGFSWGGYESLIIPTYPERVRTAVPWKSDGPTIRIHAGLENVEDLKADLVQGFAEMKKISG